LAFVVSDLTRSSDPWLVLTGDSLLVGDLARPDLVLEAEAGARLLHASLQSLLALDDHVEVWPAHVGGSLCGGSQLNLKTSSTIGFERRSNALLQASDVEFTRGVIQGIPPRPPSVERIVGLNQRSHDDPPIPTELNASGLRAELDAGVTLLDCRVPNEFDAGHLAGSVNLPVSNAGVGTRAGWALAHSEPVVIVAEDHDPARAMAIALHSVGLWQTRGYTLADQSQWTRQGLPVAEATSWDLDRLAAIINQHRVELVDVREPAEWVSGHVRGSHHVPLHRLRDGRSVSLPNNGRTTAVACSAGIRAAFAASLLRRAGRPEVVRVAGGGISDLAEHGIELDIGA
jgi:rhodanese-related sulfurtransferase